MRLTRAGEYAVRCVLYLSGQEQGEVVSRKEIAKGMEIPEQFLGKIARSLPDQDSLRLSREQKAGTVFLFHHKS